VLFDVDGTLVGSVDLHAQAWHPLPMARELVLRVKRGGKRVALASSGKADEVESNRKVLGLDPSVLETATTADDAERSKPCPDIFEAALAATRVEAVRAVAIGDSPWEALSARRAGVRTIGVLSGGFPEEDLRAAGCVAIYRDPADLLGRYEESPLPRDG